MSREKKINRKDTLAVHCSLETQFVEGMSKIIA